MAEDFDQYRHWNCLDHRWQDTNGPYYDRPTDEEIEKKLELIEDKIPDKFEYPRESMVIVDEKTNELIGTVSSYWTSIETNWLTIGVAIFNENYWNKGIGKIALSMWVSYLFENRKDIVRLDLRTWSGNYGMMKLATKLGFKQEACFRKARIVKGKYYDSLGYGILRDEWETAQTK